MRQKNKQTQQDRSREGANGSSSLDFAIDSLQGNSLGLPMLMMTTHLIRVKPIRSSKRVIKKRILTRLRAWGYEEFVDLYEVEVSNGRRKIMALTHRPGESYVFSIRRNYSKILSVRKARASEAGLIEELRTERNGREYF